MADTPPTTPARLPALVAGFAAIYLIWGSTYLGIKFAVETLPPLLMAGARFLTAGLVLYLVLRLRGGPAATAADWRFGLATGALLLLGGNGLVTWAQQTVPSGVAALIVGTTPIWMVLVGWAAFGGARPAPLVAAGMLVGFAGVALLVDPAKMGGRVSAAGAVLAVALAPVCWSFGSHYARKAGQDRSPFLASSLQMMCGGGLMLVAGTLLGEWPALAEKTVSPRSVAAMAYLTFVGSLLGFSSYVWLLRHAAPTAVATHAYVNPLVAVFLGWALGGEALSANLAAGAALVVGSVVLITTNTSSAPAAERATEPDREGHAQAPSTAEEQAA
jgi:drug/metabolite transporter (DMT)-like permease